MAKYRIEIETDDPDEVKRIFGGGMGIADVIRQAYATMAQAEIEAIREFGQPGVSVKLKVPAIPEVVNMITAMGTATVRLGRRERRIMRVEL